MILTKDYYQNEIKFPAIGTKVYRDGYAFTVSKTTRIDHILVVGAIELKGESGEVEVGYYDFLKHQSA